MKWDDVVDVVCCGSGAGVLATAIAAADADADVLIARSGAAADPLSGAAPVLFPGVGDPETREYFDSLTAGVDAPDPAGSEADLAVRIVSDPIPARSNAPVAPFYGSRLRHWTARCLASRYGVLYTRLLHRGMTSMKTPGGEEIDVRIVGTLQPRDGLHAAAAVDEWLLDQLAGRDLEVADECSLQRIVFEEGQIVGALIATPTGVRAVRARHGMAFSTASRPVDAVAGESPFDGQPLQVGLIAYAASRFGRLELVATESSTSDGRSAYCRANPAAGRSPARRSRKVHRYPPFG